MSILYFHYMSSKEDFDKKGKRNLRIQKELLNITRERCLLDFTRLRTMCHFSTYYDCCCHCYH